MEFNINQFDIDVNGIINTIKSTFEKQKAKYNFKVNDTNTLVDQDMISFKLDYEIMSSSTPGNLPLIMFSTCL